MTSSLIKASAVMLALAACSPLLSSSPEAPRLFVLSIPHPTSSDSMVKPLPFNMQIIQPEAAPGLDNERIALRKNGQEMDYFAGARWTGALPLLMQSQLVGAFENAHAFKSVGSDLVQFHADTVLALEIRDFQAEYGNDTAPTIHVRLVARLIRGQKQEIISTQTYEEKEPAAANRLQDVVMAFNTAFARAVDRLVQDSTATLSQPPSSIRMKKQ